MRVGPRKGRVIFPSQHHREVCFSIPEKRSVAAVTLMNSPTRQLRLPGGTHLNLSAAVTESQNRC